MAASNLVAVRRQDKNGRTQTRWIKGDRGPSPSSHGIPAPTAAPARKPAMAAAETEAAAAAKRLRTTRTFTYDISQWRLNDLSPALEPHLTAKLKFTATDDDFYAVLEHFTLTDALVLMNAWPDAAAKTREVYSQGKRFNIASADNGKLVAELRRRGIPAKDFIALDQRNDRVFSGHGFTDLNWCSTLLDSAEYALSPEAKTALREARAEGQNVDSATQMWTFHNDIKWGQIKLADLKAVGMGVAHSMVPTLRDALVKIAAEESRCTALELRDLLADAPDDPPLDDSLRYAAMVRAAVQYGAELTRSLRDHMSAFHSDEVARRLSTPEERWAFTAYYDAVASPDEGHLGHRDEDLPILPEDALEIWRLGIPAKQARQSLERGMEPMQIVAVHKEGIGAAVSDGWL